MAAMGHLEAGAIIGRLSSDKARLMGEITELKKRIERRERAVRLRWRRRQRR